MAEKLKPCPFCGSDAECYTVNNQTTVLCGNEACAIHPETGDYSHRAEAIAAWNRRASPPTPAEAGGMRKVRVIDTLPPSDRDRVERIARGESITEDDAHFMSRILSTVIALYGQKTNEPAESPAKVVMPSEERASSRPDTTPAGVIGGLTVDDVCSLTGDHLHWVACEIDHDRRCLDDGMNRVRWNNKAMGSMLRTANDAIGRAAALAEEVERLKKEIERLRDIEFLYDGLQ